MSKYKFFVFALEAVYKCRAYLLSSRSLLGDLHLWAGRRLICHCPPGAPRHADVLSVMFVWANVQADHKVTLSSGVLWSPLVFAKETLQLFTWIGWTLD